MGTKWFIKIFKKDKKEDFPKVLDWRDRELVRKKWQEIEDLMMIRRPSSFKQAVIDADKLLGFVLLKMNYPGSTLAERLKASKDCFSNYNGVWLAHKTRNKLVHEVGSEFLEYEARETIDRFKKGLQDLGCL